MQRRKPDGSKIGGWSCGYHELCFWELRMDQVISEKVFGKKETGIIKGCYR